MAYDFPPSPAIGQTFGKYVWDGEKWVVASAQTADADNLFINPAMDISIEKAGANTVVTAPGGTIYAVEGWAAALGFASGGGFNLGQQIGYNNTPARLSLSTPVSGGTSAAGANVYFTQTVEGQRFSGLNWPASDRAPALFRMKFIAPARNYAVAFRNGAAPFWSYVIPFTVAAADANKEIEYVFSVPPPNSGNWTKDNTAGITVFVTIAADAALLTPTPLQWVSGNFIGVTGMRASDQPIAQQLSFRIGETGLHRDPLRTGKAPPFVRPDPIDELARCQRYYEKGFYGINAYAGGAMAATWRAPFLVEKRTLPTISATPSSVGNCSLTAHDIITNADFRIYLTVAAAGGYYYAANFVANARL